MVKTGSLRLCDRESTLECAQCFPEMGARDFFLRKRYIQTFLGDVDLFLTPSQFLANRYIAWGLPAEKILVLENMPPQMHGLEPAQAASRLAAETLFGNTPQAGPTGQTGKRGGKSVTQVPQFDDAAPRKLRFGFFGQMSPLKGIAILIDAAKILHSADIEAVSIDIFGDYSNQPLEYQEAVKAALEEAGPNVVYNGRYENAEVRRLMSRVDAVIVPSIWWENSPVVIQEAFSCGKPVICSNIGGMAEKVRDGIDGLHFEAGRPQHLARLLANLAKRPEILEQAAALDAHLAAYARVLR
jgi:hypothetical protein